MTEIDAENAPICSDCFTDEGLRLDAFKMGIHNSQRCPNCHSIKGSKLTKELVRILCKSYFVRGTMEKMEYGSAPLVEFNEYHKDKSDIIVSPWLINDLKLLEQVGQIGFFYYGPNLWMLGEIEPLKKLQIKSERNHVIDEIIRTYPILELTPTNYFYRLRKNPKTPNDPSQYDSPPDKNLGEGRFDTKELPILYGSQDLELCLHECRSTAEDRLFISKLAPTKTLRFLDLTELVDEIGFNEYGGLDLALYFLFLAEKHSYPICRDLAFRTWKSGLDGLNYPSYFSYLRNGMIPFKSIYGLSIRLFPELKEYSKKQIIPNLAVFGRPIAENKVSIKCINRVILNEVSYEFTFGPT
ncbi:MAG: RES family NAD+ phosphorylase [Candidatus Odinarchaeota archaeon]